MAASGTINGSKASNGNYLYIVWSESSVNTANNTSVITASLYLANPYGSYNSGLSMPWSITIDGTTTSGTNTSFSGSPVYLGKASKTITHNANGTKSISISARFDASATSTGVVTASGTATLTTIARASVLGAAPNFNFEDTFKIGVTKYVSSYTDTLTIKIGSTTIKTITGYFNNANINLTAAELLTVYRTIANSAKTATVTFSLTTKSGSTTIGSSANKTSTGTIAGTAKIKVNGAWRRAVPWVRNASGVWRRGIVYYKNNTAWRRGA